MAASVTIRGPLDPEILRRCVVHIVHHHEILRTTFTNHNGQWSQTPLAGMPVEIPLEDLTDFPDADARAHEILQREAHTAFDLATGPLFRLRLLRMSAREHCLLRVNHHVISDAWSWKIFFHELGTLYLAELSGRPSPLAEKTTLQYGDFAAWQRRALAPGSGAHQREIAWWQHTLHDLPPAPVFPFRRSRKKADAPAADGWLWWGLDPGTSQRLDALGRVEAATYQMLRLAAFAALLAIETGEHDFIIGSYCTHRTRSEFQEMFGFFSNPVVLRFRFPRRATFREWLAGVRRIVLNVQPHGEIPFEQVCEALQQGGQRAPDLRVVFNVSDQMPAMRFGDLEFTNRDRTTSGMP